MSPEEFDQVMHDAEVKLARLRALYEQYFQGIEKMEPHVARKDLDRALDHLRRNLPRNTALRFRMQQLAARYGTYMTYWQRIGRQIEEGTYRRHVVRAQQRKHAAPRPETAWEIEVDIDAIEESSLGFDESDVDAILGAIKPMSLAPAPGPTPTAGPTGAPAAPERRAPVRTGLSAFGGAFAPRVAPKTGSGATPLPAAKPALPPVAKKAAPGPALPPVSRALETKAPPALAAKPIVAPPAKPLAPRAPMAAPARPMPAPKVPAPAVRAPAPLVNPAGVDRDAMKALYDRYADARRKNNEGAVQFETLKSSVEKMVPKLREKYGNKQVDFDVVVQNGRVGLKPKVGG